MAWIVEQSDVAFDSDTIQGTSLSDTLIGGDGSDLISGGLGSDTIFGVEVALGGTGNDRKENADLLLGGDGDDLFIGSAGDNTILGGDGDDFIIDFATGDDLKFDDKSSLRDEFSDGVVDVGGLVSRLKLR